MSIWNWLRARRDSQRVNRHIDQVVARCLVPLREAVAEQIAGLPRPEARGYARVYAAALVARQWELRTGDSEALPERFRPTVTVQAANRLAVAVVEQLRRTQPRTAATRRKAA